MPLLPQFRRGMRRRLNRRRKISVHPATLCLLLLSTFLTVRLFRPAALPAPDSLTVTVHQQQAAPTPPAVVRQEIFPTSEPLTRDLVAHNVPPVAEAVRPVAVAAAAAAAAAAAVTTTATDPAAGTEPLRTHIDAMVGEGHTARSVLTDVYAIPRPIVANMTRRVATRLYWKLLYTDVVRALRAGPPPVDPSRPRFEARASVMFIHTQNGLGNRLRSLAAGLAMARATDRVPVIIWEKDAHLGAELRDILHVDWLGSDVPTVLYKDLIVMDSFPAWPVVARREVHWHPVNYMIKDGPTARTGERMHFQMPSAVASLRTARPAVPHSFIAPARGADARLRLTRRRLDGDARVDSGLIDLKKHVYFKSAYVANARPAALASTRAVNREVLALTPSFAVNHIVQSMNATRLARSYGVHIRSRMLANDNTRVDRRCEYTRAGAKLTDYWRARSQPRVFIEKMDEVVRNDADATFFVATDDFRVLRTLQKRFPGRIDSVSRSCDGRDGSCVLYAMADLICLSRTKSMFGSYWSSFSEAAGRMSGKPVLLSGRDFGREQLALSPRWLRRLSQRARAGWKRWVALSEPTHACDKAPPP